MPHQCADDADSAPPLLPAFELPGRYQLPIHRPPLVLNPENEPPVLPLRSHAHQAAGVVPIRMDNGVVDTLAQGQLDLVDRLGADPDFPGAPLPSTARVGDPLQVGIDFKIQKKAMAHISSRQGSHRLISIRIHDENPLIELGHPEQLHHLRRMDTSQDHRPTGIDVLADREQGR